MRGYNPQDSKAVDELDPCIAAEIRAKNERLFQKSHRCTIIIIAILITLICAAAVLLLVYFFASSSADPTNTTPNHDSDALKESGFLNHPKNTEKTEPTVPEYEELLDPGKAMGDVTADKERALPPPSDSVVPMNRPPMTVIEKPMVAETTNTPVFIPRRPEVTTNIIVPTKAVESVTYSTKSDEIPDIVPSFSSINNDKYFPVETDDIFEDCEQYRKHNHDQSGVYNIRINGNTFRALCLMEPDYAWMVLQRRTSDHLSFNRTFEEYAEGFGSLFGDHWLGLERVYQYVKSGHKLQLRIELRGDHCDECSKLGADGYWWGDWSFAVGSKKDKYKLEISSILHGNLTDAANDEFYKLNNGQPFTTYDQDNDSKPRVNCANFRKYGPWWHRDCSFTALNGAYGARTKTTSSMVWLHKQRKSGPNNALDSYSIKPQMSLMMFRILKS